MRYLVEHGAMRAGQVALLPPRVVSAIAIVLTGAALAACGGGADTGGGDTRPGTTTGAASGSVSPSETSPTPEPVAVGGGEPIDLRLAINLGFLRSKIVVPPGAEVRLTLENRDPVPHNFSVYLSQELEQSIFVGDQILGPRSITYEFGAPVDAGTYYFQCDIHPIMNGDFIVE